jgi:hypothetical protein
MTKTPGEIAYSAWRDRMMAALSTTPIPMWFQQDTHTKEAWELAAGAVVAANPPKEIVPETYVDAVPLVMNVFDDPAAKTLKVTFETTIQRIEAMHARPGSMEDELERVKKAVENRNGKLRISLVTDNEIKTELARLERDGTVRELAADEGTW